MPKEIEPKLKTIREYLNLKDRSKFIIPEYQRSYSWTTEACDKLWQDIEAFMDSSTVNDSGKKEPYFFGTIIADCSEQENVSLIDGQQRTTTFILLMKALLLRIQKELKAITRDNETETLIDALKERRNVIVDTLYQTDADNRSDILKNPERMKGRCILESKSINESGDYKGDLCKIVGVCNRLKKLAEIWEVVQDYPVVKLLLKFNENAKLYLISFLNRFEPNELTPEKTLHMTECLIRLFTVMELVDVGYSSSKFKTFLFGENVKLVDKTVSIDVVKHDFDEHISRCWKEEELKEALRDYEKNIIVFLNEYLYAKEHRLPFDFSDSVNVEHIMPGSGRNLDAIRSDAGIETKEEFDFLVNQLGNKILLEEDINKSISNDWFRTKKQKTVTEKKGYKDSKYGIASALAGYPSDTWKKEDIAAATEKAVSRIIRFIFGCSEG